ncbi:MAG: penicillin-insensitive murein endopeptidase [Candidatus Methylumidiphilus sp.]
MRPTLETPRRHASPLAFFCLSLGIAAFSPAPKANGWSAVDTPNDGPARSIGLPSSGCISGAHSLPLEGTGYEVMHIERNRYYGHPRLVQTIEDLGHLTARRKLGLLHVGDLGQPRGGPMSFGHRSHQTGLDVDIWFDLNPRLSAGANATRGNLDAPSMLLPSKKGLNYAAWTANQMAVLELAANLPGVDRIFVNAHIKKELCEQAEGEREWLRKIRPWHYHDDHFHLRMSCPDDSPSCDAQDPIPPGEGCDASLDWWFQHQPAATPPSPPPPKPRLPLECQDVLSMP